jgi:hypothetical protein
VLFAVTTNLQREAAASVPTSRGPLHLVHRLVTNPRWLLAGVIGAAALSLHALALARGSVVVVQSMMALGLVIALHIEAAREERHLTVRELSGAALVVAGVVAVVAICSPHGASDAGLGICVLSGLVVAVTVGLLVHSRRSVVGPFAARGLAAAAGACFAVDAVFLQRVATVADQALLGSHVVTADDVLLAAVSLAGFLATSFAGGVAVHRAYQVAPLRSVQPALASAEPLTAFVVGVAVLQQGVRGGGIGYVVLVLGLAAITAGIALGVGHPTAPSAGLPRDERSVVHAEGRLIRGDHPVSSLR